MLRKKVVLSQWKKLILDQLIMFYRSWSEDKAEAAVVATTLVGVAAGEAGFTSAEGVDAGHLGEAARAVVKVAPDQAAGGG